MSIQGFVQNLAAERGAAPPRRDGARSTSTPGRRSSRCLLSLDPAIAAALLIGQRGRALEFAAKAKPILWSARPNLQSMDYCFYHSLAVAAVFPASSPERRAALREDFIAHLESFQRWAASCPATFAHKHALISAEWARLEGRDIEAMPLYEQAIRLAAEHGFLQDQALASELAAQFYRLRGLEKVADTYLDEARDCYVRWGAWAKVAQLDKSHPGSDNRHHWPQGPPSETSVERLVWPRSSRCRKPWPGR